MVRQVVSATMLFGAAMLAGCAMQSLPFPAPPPPQVEIVPKPPISAVPLVWRPGDWRWTGSGYAWQPGDYEPMAGHGRQWLPGHWDGDDGRYAWVPGHWL
jgi:hypothetical protein